MRFKINTYVCSLSECLNIINKWKNRNKDQYKYNRCDFFYRGESKDNNVTTLESKLFRPIKRISHENYSEYGNLLLYFQGSNALYRELTHYNRRIDNDFMAYCQHHGFPTPLLDITSSLLTGLYFTCCSTDNKDGFLYIFHKNNFLEYSPDYLKYDNDIDKLNPYNNLREMIKAIYRYESSDAYDNEFMIHWTYMRTRIVIEFHNFCKENKDNIFNKSVKELNKINSLQDLDVKLRNEIINSDDRLSNMSLLSKSYVKFLKLIKYVNNISVLESPKKYPDYYYGFTDDAFLYVFYIYMSRHISNYNIINRGLIPKELLFKVTTHYNWDRIKAQHGSFIIECPLQQVNSLNIIQKYTKNDKRKNDYSIINKKYKNWAPNIIPDYVIGIKAKYKPIIMSELNDLGINEEFLFKDTDHISNYIQDKYFTNRFND